MRDDRERLLDIQQAIERIERYAVRGRMAFERDELIQNWMVSHLQTITLALRSVHPKSHNAKVRPTYRGWVGKGRSWGSCTVNKADKV